METRPAIADDFVKRCITIHTFPNEYALTIHLQAIVGFYIDRIGVGPVVTIWPEIQASIDYAMARAKAAKAENLPLVVRLSGGGVPVWLCLKIFSAVVYQADSIYYVGDVAMKI